MPLAYLTAVAHPDGNRVDVSWRAATTAPAVTGVRVVRREGRYPAHPDDGVVVAEISVGNSVSDTNLPSERVYYYGLFPYVGDPPSYEMDTANRAAVLVTAPNGYGAYMLKLLPAIYHRYDRDTQFLARFLQLTGGHLDQAHSLANFSARLRHLQHTPGNLLPLLAQWIGWKTDYKRDLASQRNEIAYAPALYRRTGILPTVEATIKRISGWESRSKEYVHNVFASNRAARLNLWGLTRAGNGVWATQEQLHSLDYCYEGRASHAADSHTVQWLCYHTQRQGRWEIWSKTSPRSVLSVDLVNELAAGTLTLSLWQALTQAGIELDQTAQLVNVSSHVWQINDGPRHFIIEQSSAELIVYDVNNNAGAYAASQPIIVDNRINKYPSIANQSGRLWLFWTSYDTTNDQWRVHYRRRSNAAWDVTGPRGDETATSNPFIRAGVFDATVARRRAYVTADDQGGLWLFWQERTAARWQVFYNYHDGATWGEPIALPLDGLSDPQMQDDLMVLATPSAPTPRLYLFWARQRPVASASGSRWQVALRVKSDQQFTNANWSAVHTLPKAVIDNHHDREPFAVLNSLQQPEVFWASNRSDSGWAVWRTTLLDYSSDSWGAPERITDGVYQQRAPLAIVHSAGMTLLYRSSRHVVYRSDVYRSSENYDERYAGSLLSDARHQQVVQLRDQFEDPQRYTYDMGDNGKRDDSHRIARDTIGAFLLSETLDDDELHRGIDRLRQVLDEFMPMTDRAVFVPNKLIHADYVYGYDLPPHAGARYLAETYSDEWLKSEAINALQPDEDFSAVLNNGV